MRKKDDSLRETLLDHARELVEKEGLEAVNIRSLARDTGIAVGTVYNYFSCKDEILLGLTEEYWRSTLRQLGSEALSGSFCEQLEGIFYFLKKRIDSSGGMLMHSLANVKELGQERMEAMEAVLASALVKRMDQDPDVRGDIWREGFTKEQYARFIMANMVMLLRDPSCDFPFFLEMIRRTIYAEKKEE